MAVTCILDIHGDQTSFESVGQSFGRADDLGRGRTRANTNQESLVCRPDVTAAQPRTSCLHISMISFSGLSQCQFAECNKIVSTEEVLQCPPRLVWNIHFPGSESLQQILGRDVDDRKLIR